MPSESYCRVCGYEPEEPPWGEDGCTPSFEICPSCGVEWGYQDATDAGVRRYRAAWLANGGNWADQSVPGRRGTGQLDGDRVGSSRSSTAPAASAPWVRVLHLGGDTWLGLVDDALFVGDHETPKREVERLNPTGLLPCLERPYDVVVAELQAREVELCLAQGSLTDLVPLDAIPAAAVNSQIDYWVQLALDWLSSMPGDAVPEEILELIQREPWPTRRARHRARNLLKARQ